jgi:hypothetical protein
VSAERTPKSMISGLDSRQIHLEEPNQPAFSIPSYELPGTYGQDYLVLLVRDPDMLFATWEISSDSWQHLTHDRGVSGPVTMRLWEWKCHDRQMISEIEVEGTHSWYINLAKPGIVCNAEIGIKGIGQYYPIARSAKVSIPTGRESDLTDPEWATIEEVIYRSRVGNYAGSSY